MKKIYLQPETIVINVNLESSMLSGSENLGGNRGDFDPGTQQMGSRGGRYGWEEEEEEEDY